VPLVYETLAGSIPDDGNLADELPVTFADGIPVRFFRPGRLLAAWVAWVREGFPQSRLVSIVRESLLVAPGMDEAKCSYSRLAVLLRNLGIGFGRDRYLAKVDEEIAALERRIAGTPAEDEGDDEQRKRPAPRRLEELRLLRALVQALLATSPSPDDSQATILDSAHGLLETLARTVSKSDNFARQRLVEEITDLRSWLDDSADPAAIDVWTWLTDLPREARVLGSGPRPGCLHVAGIPGGGHSARSHTFLVGLDDGRFPGGGSQDPLLLDWERERISKELPTAAGQLAERLSDFHHLVARLRGTVTFSFSSRDLADDRDKFPSSVLLSAWRIVSGNREGSQEEFLKWFANPVSFAPADAEHALDLKDWWLQQLCVGEPVREAEQVVLTSYPHLARGREAQRHRSSADFTVFDGQVAQAAKDVDPTGDNGPVMSSGRLEMLGICPLRFFFRHGLGIELPEELELDPTRWLDPLAAGAMLHEVFEQFIRELVEGDELPQFPEHLNQLEAILASRADEYRDLYPPLSEHLYETQMAEFRQVIRTFLVEESRYCIQTGNRPVYLEASLGMSAGDHGTKIDTEAPVPIHLPDGSKLFARGRVDRIDCVGSGAVRSYAIWDYKTGSAWKYDPLDPFREGRVVQPVIYMAMVGHRMKEIGKGERIDIAQFGFFFPGRRERGRRIEWTPAQLKDGPEVLSRLVQIIRNGAFLATDDADDCRYCNYRTICGDVQSLAAQSADKLANVKNTQLNPLKELRGYGKAKETT
jgi:ATP-dependent helicase/nuclease subunit B